MTYLDVMIVYVKSYKFGNITPTTAAHELCCNFGMMINMLQWLLPSCTQIYKCTTNFLFWILILDLAKTLPASFHDKVNVSDQPSFPAKGVALGMDVSAPFPEL